GLLVRTLRASAVWAAMTRGWQGGAVLAGSSAGAMALCEWSLVMARWPRHEQRRAGPALGVVPRPVGVPRFQGGGRRWTVDDPPEALTLLGLDERTAAVWNAEGWHAAGAGGVTVIGGGETRRFEPGRACEGIPEPGLQERREG